MNKDDLINKSFKEIKKQIMYQYPEFVFNNQFKVVLEKLYSDAFSDGYDAAPKSDRDSWND